MQMEESPNEDDFVAVEMKSDIQLILSALCESDMHRKVKLRSCIGASPGITGISFI